MRFLITLSVLCVTGQLLGQTEVHPIQVALNAGKFGQAETLIAKIPELSDQWLGKMALAQVKRGDSESAKNSLRQIQDSSQLTRASGEIAGDAQGGATGADFDSLINLITSTVEPDSWDDVGGPGAILSFPGGIAVDAQGVVRRKKIRKASRVVTLELIRDTAKKTPGSSEADARTSSALRMVSLPRLERELMLRVAFGEKPTDAMRHMAGLYEIRYLFIFPETNDIVIAGPAAAWSVNGAGQAVTDVGQPVLLLDDLVTLLRNAREQEGRFGCSIDPKQKSLAATKAFLDTPTGTLKPHQTKRWVDQIRDKLGLQNVSIYGVDPRSHVGHVLVEADYHMKLVGMGLEPGAGDLKSYLASIPANAIPTSMDVMRWWFTLRTGSLKQNAEGTAYEFAKQCVQLQTENERLANDGKRTHTGKASGLNQTFAHNFTREYPHLCRAYPIYAELENLFRMSLVAGVLQTSTVQSQVDWNADWLASGVKSALGIKPVEVPSIVNHRVINRKHVVVGVSGGVTVNVSNVVRNMKRIDDDSTLVSSTNAANRVVPKTNATWWWD